MFLFIGIVVVAILFYIYGSSSLSYWARKGVKHDKPIPFFGNSLPVVTQKISLNEAFTDLYRKYPDEKIVGYYLGNDARLLIRDPKIVSRIIQTDFQYFHARGILPHPNKLEPVLKNLFLADGDIWKLLRQRLTPAFSTGKLKAMFPIIIQTTERLKKIAVTAAESGEEVDVRDLMSRYTTDFIGACGFGIDADSLSDENSTFRKIGKRIFEVSNRDAIVFALKFIAPRIFKNLQFLVPEIEAGLLSIIKQVVNERNNEPSTRNDYIDLLLDIKRKGKITGESIEKRNPDGTPGTAELVMDELLMAGQVFNFFAAGFETSSSSMSFALHHLAFHPDAQRKCQQEIDEVLRRHDNQLCYDAVKEMKYLEMCLKESLRLVPPISYALRKCVKKYTIPDTDVTIDEGVGIIIAIHAMQNDERFFENPEKFLPERMHSSNINNFEKCALMPFGQGPRACIGERLGLMQSLAGLAALLADFSVAPSKNTQRYPEPDPSSNVVQAPKHGLPLALVARKK